MSILLVIMVINVRVACFERARVGARDESENKARAKLRRRGKEVKRSDKVHRTIMISNPNPIRES